MSAQTFIKKCQKWSNLASFWKPKACGQTELPDISVLIGQKLVENAKIQMRHFEWFSNIVSNGIFGIFIFYYPEEIPHPSIKRQKVFVCCQNFVKPQCRFCIYDRKNMARVSWESICWRRFVFTTSKYGLENTKTGRR